MWRWVEMGKVSVQNLWFFLPVIAPPVLQTVLLPTGGIVSHINRGLLCKSPSYDHSNHGYWQFWSHVVKIIVVLFQWCLWMFHYHPFNAPQFKIVSQLRFFLSIILLAGRSGIWIPAGQGIFSYTKHPDQLWGPPSLLFSGYWAYFSEGKVAGAWYTPLTSI